MAEKLGDGESKKSKPASDFSYLRLGKLGVVFAEINACC